MTGIKDARKETDDRRSKNYEIPADRFYRLLQIIFSILSQKERQYKNEIKFLFHSESKMNICGGLTPFLRQSR